MKLINLKLNNFKGIKEFELDSDGESLAIFGDNGTGKTTLFDAFSWLLFDKDSANRKDFEIKTLGPDGEPIHGLEHEVEGVLEINELQIILKKVYSETWTKKRGSVDRQFTGHTTDYFLNGVPTKKNEYEAWIASIVDEEAFKLLTNPRHFNEILHWQDRRKILLEVCGDLSDADVIAADSKLAKLPDILNGRKLEDHRKVIAARCIAINKDIEMIPVRISEVDRGLPDAMPPAFSRKELEDLRGEHIIKSRELANLEAGGGVAEKTKELNIVETEMTKANREDWTKIQDEVQAKKEESVKLDDERRARQHTCLTRSAQIDENKASIERYEVKLSTLRQDWNMANLENLTFVPLDMCPACGQSLPAEQLEAAKEKATGDFNLKKAENLATITEEGHSIKAKIDELTKENKGLELQNTSDWARVTALVEEVKSVRDAITALENKEMETPSNPAYLELALKKRDIESDIEKLHASHIIVIDAMRTEISTIDKKIAEAEAAIAKINQREVGLQRIEELKAEEKKLAKEFEKLEGELFLTDEFVRTKVKLLEDRINSRFKMARFKLFNQLVNGGIEEVCETIYLGVPYGSALNNSARINIGLDIINTLTEHFQFVAPIWIDNAEAITQLLPTKGQQIRLYVSEVDKALRIENLKEVV